MDIAVYVTEINDIVLKSLHKMSVVDPSSTVSRTAMNPEIVDLLSKADDAHIKKLLQCNAPIATIANATEDDVWAQRFKQAKAEVH